MDEPLVWYEGAGVGAGSRRYLHADHQGSVIAVSDAAGTVLGVNRYDPYGVPSAGNIGRFSYTGQTRIDELGLYYYKARIYNPWLGRFMQTDPIGYEDDLNLYAYVGGDPVNRTDPTGMEVEAIFSQNSRALFVVDNDSRRFAMVEATSGGKPFGDTIPSGSYAILEQARRDGFSRLEAMDERFGDDAVASRSLMRLHGPGLTVGCIEVCRPDGFRQIRDILDRTRRTDAEVDRKGVAGVFGSKEKLGKFGTLSVLPSDFKLSVDQNSGVVSIRGQQTGSRIEREVKVCTIQKDGTCEK